LVHEGVWLGLRVQLVRTRAACIDRLEHRVNLTLVVPQSSTLEHQTLVHRISSHALPSGAQRHVGSWLEVFLLSRVLVSERRVEAVLGLPQGVQELVVSHAGPLSVV
jgi:hypothetical protein